MAGLAEAGFDVGDDTAVVVEWAENDRPLRAAGDGVRENGAVQGISLPKFSAHGCFPSIVGGAFELHFGYGQSLTLENQLYGGERHLVVAGASGKPEFAQHERSRATRIFTLEIDDELFEFGSQAAVASLVGTGLGLEGLKARVAMLVKSTFEGLVGHAPMPSKVIFEGLFGHLGERPVQLSPAEAATEQIPEDSVPEKGFFGAIIIVYGCPPLLVSMMAPSFFIGEDRCQKLPL